MPYQPIKNPQPWLAPVDSTPGDVVTIEHWCLEKWKLGREALWSDGISLFGEDLPSSIRFHLAVMNSTLRTNGGKFVRPWQYRWVAPNIRRKILSVGCCASCGSTDQLSIDHIKPVSKGGRNDRENLQCLCLPCNIRKGNRYAKRG